MMDAKERFVAPVDQRKRNSQRDLLMKYIAEQGLLTPDVLVEYVNHEFMSQANEPVRVSVDVKIYGGSDTCIEQSFVFTLEELKMFQQRTMQSGSLPPVPVITTQADWAGRREAVLSRAAELERESRRLISNQLVGGATEITCRCVAGNKEYICDHLQFAYATGWERGTLLDESGRGTRRSIRLPIGMGAVKIDLCAEILEDDTRPLGQLRTGYVEIRDLDNAADRPLRKLADATSPYPEETSKILLAPGEGVIKAIRYIESLLRATDVYQKLSKMPTNGDPLADPFKMADSICRRTHSGTSGRKLASQFLAGMRPNSEHRNNWMMACAYTVTMYDLCLPCNRATTGSAFVPNS